MSLATLQAGLALLTSDYTGAEDGACLRALQLGDRNLADAAALAARVEARSDAVAQELFLANVRKSVCPVRAPCARHLSAHPLRAGA